MIDIEKAREIEAAATPGPWEVEDTDGLAMIVTADGYAVAYPASFANIRTSMSHGRDNNLATATFIAFARSFAPEAIAEIEHLRKTLDDASYEDGDHLPKECRRMIETFWGEMAMHREAAPKLKAEIERLRKLLIQACDIGKYVATEHTGKSENLDRLAAIRAEVKS